MEMQPDTQEGAKALANAIRGLNTGAAIIMPGKMTASDKMPVLLERAETLCPKRRETEESCPGCGAREIDHKGRCTYCGRARRGTF